MNETSPAGSPPSTTGRTLTVGSLSYTRAGLAMTFFWLLLGAFAWALKGRAAQPTAQLMLSNFGASDDTASALIGSAPGLIVLFALPFLGCISDRFRSHWGRRIPFLAMMLPLVAIALVGLAASPWLGSFLDRTMTWHPLGFDNNTIMCLAIFWGLFSFTDIVGYAIYGALANDVVPQYVMGRFFGAVRVATLLAGVIFNYYLFGHADANYVPILLGIGMITLVAFGVMCVKVREGTYPPAPTDSKGLAEVSRKAHNYFHECFGSPFYLLLFVAWGLSFTAWNSVNYYSVFIATGFITPAHYGEVLTLTYMISLVLAYPLGVLADRYHPLRLGIVTLALYAVAMLWSGIYVTTPLTFDIAFVLQGVLSGMFLSGTASLLQRMLPRLKFAQFASAAGVMVSLCNVLITPLAGYVLNAMHHDCRSIFLLSSAQSWLGLLAIVFLYRAYQARGGDKKYVPPGQEYAQHEPAGVGIKPTPA